MVNSIVSFISFHERSYRLYQGEVVPADLTVLRHSFRVCAFSAILAAVLSFGLHCTSAFGQTETTHNGMPPGEHHHHPPSDEAAQQAGVGLDPHTGEQLPLDLTFRDEQGRSVRLGDLLDGPTLILPVYYRCPNVCSFLQAGVAEVLGEVARTPGRDYKILSISFNERETSADAQKARQTYRSIAGRAFPENAWHFLTGDEEQIRALYDAAGYSFMRRGEDFLHPVVSFVVSGEGQIIRYLYGTRPLPKDLTLAFYEAQSGRAGATIRKVVQFCFSYDRESQTYAVNLLRISATVILLCVGLFLAYLLLTGKRKKDKNA